MYFEVWFGFPFFYVFRVKKNYRFKKVCLSLVQSYAKKTVFQWRFLARRF